MSSAKTVFWEVDTQVDFMLPGGKLYVRGAENLLPNLKRLVDAARSWSVFLISSSCAHLPDDPEFKDFPPHCLRGEPGAEIVPEGLAPDVLRIPNDAAFRLPPELFTHQQIVIEKQVLDVFSNPHTSSIVKMLGANAEFIVFGVVTEYCVRLAAKGLLERGRKVAIVKDAIETLDADAGRRTIGELTAAGVRLITASEALAAAAAQASQQATK
jgi:nicotinamidase/pyrazinamidase